MTILFPSSGEMLHIRKGTIAKEDLIRPEYVCEHLNTPRDIVHIIVHVCVYLHTYTYVEKERNRKQ